MKEKRTIKVISLTLVTALLLSIFSVSVLAEDAENASGNGTTGTQLTNEVYKFTNSIEDNASSTVTVPYFNKYQTNNSGAWNYDNIQISKENGFMSYNASLFNLGATNGLNIDLGMHYNSDSAEIINDAENNSFNNFYDSRYSLGAGWSFNIPTIEFVGTTKYLHTSEGQKYKITSLNKLEGYYLNNITFNAAQSGEFTVNSVAAVYRLIDSDNGKTYFDEAGKCIGVTDRIGNKIQIEYNSNNFIDKIIEPAGRYVKFNYQTESGSRIVTATLFDNKTESPDSQRIFTINQLYDEANGCYKLTSVVDSIDRQISFDYSVYENENSINSDSNIYSLKSLLLTGIENYNGAYTGIDYTNKLTSNGSNGTKEYQAVSKCYKKDNKSSTSDKEKTTYSYQYENTVSWRFTSNNTINSDATMKATASQDQYASEGKKELRTETTINSISRNIKDRNYSYILSNDNETITDISTVEYSGYNACNIPVVTINKTLGENGKFLFTRSKNVYDSIGNITDSTVFSGTGNGDTLNPYTTVDSKSRSNYDYTVSKTTPVITAEYTKSDSENIYAMVTFNKIASNTGKISESVVKTYKMTSVTDLSSLTNATPLKELTKTNYTYAANGNLTKETVNDLQYGGEQVTSYTYDSKYNSYIVRTSKSGIKNSDGNTTFNVNGSSDLITRADFDMFGNEIVSYDESGNKTFNYYDKAGNLIKTAKNDTPYKTIYDWENENVGTEYPNISGLNSDTTVWTGKFEVTNDSSHLCSGSEKGIKVTNKTTNNSGCRIALNVTPQMMENSLGLRFFAAPSKAGGGIKVEFKKPGTMAYDVYTTASTTGGWIDISWTGQMYKNGPDVWKWTYGTVDELRTTTTIWITF